MRSRKMRAETAAKMKVCSQVLGCRNGRLNQVWEKTVTNSKAIPRASRMLGALRGRVDRVRFGFSGGNPMIIREQNGSDCYNQYQSAEAYGFYPDRRSQRTAGAGRSA